MRMLLRTFNIMLYLLFFVTSYISAESLEKFKTIKTDEFEGAIIAKEQVPQLRFFREKRTDYWTPTEQEIVEAEKLSKAYFEKYNGADQYVKASIPSIVGEWGKYKRQYVGLIEKNEDKTVWINYFYDSRDFSYWDEEFPFVLGGGRNYFNIKVNLNKKECYDVQINSPR